MTTVSNYVDLSTKSLVVAGVVFLAVAVLAKFTFDYYSSDVKEEEKRSTYLTILYSILIGFIFALLTLVAIKQIGGFGSCDILTEPFPTRP
jgi:hypothetical protein